MKHIILENVIFEHVYEAAFLFVLRAGSVAAPHYALWDVKNLDARLDANLDGVRVAAAQGWNICAQQLAIGEPGEAFVAAALAFESAERARIERVLQVAAPEPELTEAVVSALGWLPADKAQNYGREFLNSEAASLRRIGLACFAIHRQNPGDALRLALRDKDEPLQARAAKAVGELGRTDLVQDLNPLLSAENPNVSFWAAWSSSLLTGSGQALGILPNAAGASSKKQTVATQMSMRRLPLAEAKVLQKRLVQPPEFRRLAIIAAGALGDPENIPWLIEQTKSLSLARLAGEAFTMITGVDLAYRDLERKPPEDFNAGPTDDPKDENVEMDPDDNLPWPEPSLVQKWWDKNRGQFQNGTRYLLGKPMAPDWLKKVLRDGRQRQRAAAALELAIRQPGTPLFNVKAPGFRQIEILGKPGEPIR